MGLFSFVKDAGAAIFGGSDEESDITKPTKSLSAHLRESGIDPSSLQIDYEANRIVVSGEVASQEDKEKIIMIIGNVRDVEMVEDRLVLASAADAPAPTAADAPATEGAEATPEDWQADTYTVQSGDTLGGIAQKLYGSASKYMVIFEANTPMLKDPNKIYPGQVLRIPPQ
jgi:nucleoid-associated protein YgaU